MSNVEKYWKEYRENIKRQAWNRWMLAAKGIKYKSDNPQVERDVQIQLDRMRRGIS